MAVLAAVQEQYETLPYPPRDPADEKKRLLRPATAHLPLVNHVLWKGARQLDREFSVLDAGCGTGDATIFIAEQLRSTGGGVVALDISKASLDIVQQRAEVRGLQNVTFVQAPIEDIPRLGLGQFDLVFSSGVLHHLPSPDEGLAALATATRSDGGLALMVYGTHGRLHVYQMQRLLQLVAPPELGQTERLRIARRVIDRLRPSHWAALGRTSWSAEIDRYGVAGLFDLFLHAQDRAYTVPEVHQWLDAAGLKLRRWHLPPLYDPTTYGVDVNMDHLSAVERESAAELLHGRMATHAFFAVHRDQGAAAPASDDPSAVPRWLLANAHDLVDRHLRDGRELDLSYSPELQRRIPLDPFTRGVLRRVDDVTSIGAIIEAMQRRLNVSDPGQLWERWRSLYTDLERFNLVGLAAA